VQGEGSRLETRQLFLTMRVDCDGFCVWQGRCELMLMGGGTT
jgi:hypothetical protein